MYFEKNNMGSHMYRLWKGRRHTSVFARLAYPHIYHMSPPRMSGITNIQCKYSLNTHVWKYGRFKFETKHNMSKVEITTGFFRTTRYNNV